MIPVVIDTNIVVSANRVKEGPSAAILLLAVNQKFIQMCISPAILAEYEEVMRRPRLKFPPSKIEEALALIRSTARMVYPTRTLHISPDASDNRFYECAEAAEATYLITGNTEAFPQARGPTKIISPRDFLDQVVPGLMQSEL